MLEKYYKQNVIGISSVEFLWGLGLPVVIESTFLQLFIKSLGASSFEVGMIPAFFFAGLSVFALLSSYFTSDMAFKRGAVIVLHLVSGISLVVFGSFLFVFGRIPAILLVFFTSYAIFSVCIGMTVPVWLNYIVNIFTEDRSISGLGYIMLAQNIARLISSLVIVKLVEKYAFSLDASALIFMVVGMLFALGGLLFLLTKEVPLRMEGEAEGKHSFWQYTKTSANRILHHRNFLIFLAGDMDFYVVVTVISFYANYATAYCDIAAPIAAGMFVGFIYVGAILANIILGSLDLFSIRNKYIISKAAAMAAICTLITFGYQWSFFMVSLLLGASRGTRMIVYAPSVKKLSGMTDTTSYFAVAPILTTPFAASLPLIFGRFLDSFAWLNGDAYRIIFAVAVLMIFGSLSCMLRVDFNPHFENE